MPRSTRLALAALPLAALLAACGAQEATQGSVRDDVKEALLVAPDYDDLSDEEAGAVADCVSRGMFESGDFSKEERDDVTRAIDSDEADPQLIQKLQALLDRCLAGDDGEEEEAGEG